MDISELEEGETISLTNSASTTLKPGDSTTGLEGTSTPSGSHDGVEIIPTEDEKIWPSANDLNSRLRRLVTSYQRSANKKEDVKNAPLSNNGKANQDVKMGNHQSASAGIDPAALTNVQGWDLQKLAMYLLVSSLLFEPYLL